MSNMYEDPIYDEVGTSYDSNIPSEPQLISLIIRVVEVIGLPYDVETFRPGIAQTFWFMISKHQSSGNSAMSGFCKNSQRISLTGVASALAVLKPERLKSRGQSTEMSEPVD
ncbi:hypothetical protein Tco_0551043 [Tanacetum coccineum]